MVGPDCTFITASMAELSPDFNLSHYRVISKIGAGGMGEVYLAQDTKLDRKVALKILPAELATNQDRMRRFSQEAKAASALNHPNIVTIYEIDQTDSGPFMATEFIDGQTLRERLRLTPMKVNEALEVATQVAGALAAAHAAGIVHRDIKPENVMIRYDALVKVLDFGLAKLFDSAASRRVDSEAPTRDAINTDTGVVMGTAVYMSPEQARGLAVDARTDIFSLGVILYEMIAGRLPFAGSNTNEILASILSDKDPAPLARYTQDSPAELERIVSKALRKNRDERYQTIKDLLIDLKRLKDDLDFENRLERSSSPRSKAATASEMPARLTREETNGIRWRSVVIGLAALLVLSAGVGLYLYRVRAGSGPITSLAVLPFINASGTGDVDYLSDGMTDSLINSLSTLPGMKVIAKSSSFQYKNKEVDPQQVAKALGVEAILTGKLTQRADTLTISIELVNAEDKSHIWGEQYIRNTSDLLALQQELSTDISEKLRVKLTGEEQKRLTKRYTENVEAYQLYLKGRYFADQYSADGFQKAVEHFNQAIQKDPNYALAYTGLADSYWVVSALSLPPREAMPKAREAAVKALRIDDTLAEAHSSLALVQAFYDYDLSSAEREFKRAIELNPGSAAAHQWYGWYLFVLNRTGEALKELKRAQELDPLSMLINGELGMAYHFSRQYDRAIEAYQKAIEMDPNNSFARIGLARLLTLKGEYEKAIEVASKPESDDPYLVAAIGAAYARWGKRAEAEKVIERLKERSKQSYIPPYAVCGIYIGLGKKQQALDWLEKSYEYREDAMLWLNSDPVLDDLRSEPRFHDLVRRVGLPQ
jgi:eukaryotic-like serine/threonine-protein kinase